MEGNTTGVAVFAPMMLVAGSQLKFPVPVAVSCRLSRPQYVVSLGNNEMDGVGNTITSLYAVSRQPLLFPEISFTL